MSEIEVTVKSQKGKCAFGHKVGDKIVFNGRCVKGDICYSALMVILPKIYAMNYDAHFPWAADDKLICQACPDADNPVVLELRKIKKSKKT